MKNRFLSVLKKEPVDRTPFWFMRQAGRYLPEYMEVRGSCTNFLDLVYSSEKAIEVTLQPIRRFGADAAILFADILVIPDALGQKVGFVSGKGPQLEAINTANQLNTLSLDAIHVKLAPIYETVKGLKESLPADVALIGFAGSPWTVATYMIEGMGSKDHAAAKDWYYRDRPAFLKLMNMLVEATSDYLIKQIDAGADALQLFDTWAGSLSENMFDDCCIQPTQKIVAAVKSQHPDIPIIGFPKGIGVQYRHYIQQTKVDAVGFDASTPLEWIAQEIQPMCPVQGNLDPRLVVNGGHAMLDEVERILSTLSKGGHIFNLGHGFVPETPPKNVEILADYIKNWRP